MKSVSENFHEKALKVRSGLPVNLIAFTEDSPKGVTDPPFNRDPKASRLERDSSIKNIVKTNNESPSKPSTTKSRENSTSTDQAEAGLFGRSKPSMLYTQENIDPRLHPRFHEAASPTTSEPILSSASTGLVAYAALFESVVYPAMKKSKKRHKDSLPREELDAIGKTVSLTSMLGLKKMSLNRHALIL